MNSADAAPVVSVVTAVYNGADYLPECLESILAQSFSRFEMLVVDDASTDETARLVEEFARRDARVHLLRNRRNLGRAVSRNRALEVARGKYVAILDGDDVALPHRLEAQVDFLDRRPGIFLVAGRAERVTEAGEFLKLSELIGDEKKLRSELGRRNMLIHSTVMFRRDPGTAYREKFAYAQDYDLFLQVLARGDRIQMMGATVARYRHNPSAVSSARRLHQKLFANQALRFYHQRCRSGGDDYDRFDSRAILDLDIETTRDREALALEVRRAFKFGEYPRARRFARRYLAAHGASWPVLKYWFLSLFRSA